MGDFAAPKLETVRVAFIGVGARGVSHAKQVAAIEGSEVVAICDLFEDYALRSKKNCEEAGNGERHQAIKLYHGKKNLWKKMLQELKPDAVFIATPWKDHAPMAIQVMKRGAHAFVEVPLGLTNEELQRCQYHVHIPSNPEFSSLNLAAAVQVLAYEVRMAWLTASSLPTKVEKLESTAMLNAQAATADELESFYGHLRRVLVMIGFLDPQKPRHLMTRLRRLYGRSAVSKLEMNILRGILTETEKAVRGESHKQGKPDV